MFQGANHLVVLFHVVNGENIDVYPASGGNSDKALHFHLDQCIPQRRLADTQFLTGRVHIDHGTGEKILFMYLIPQVFVYLFF